MVLKKLNWYERLCSIFSHVRLPIPKALRKRYQEEIDFCHLEVSPEAVFSTALLLPTVVAILLLLVFQALNILSTTLTFIVLLFSCILFYYLLNYTRFLTIYYRSKAASEMTLAIVYMSTAMKIDQNLESAIAFAASNLSGPLGLDLKNILWELQTGKKYSAVVALDELAEKWKAESEEFVDALHLIKASSVESPERMEKNLKEAVDLMLSGTKTRMKKYVIEMRTPLQIISTFGILLPLLFLVFVPILIIFTPEIARPELIIFSYDFFLPAIIYLLLKQYFYTRPYSYHQIEMLRLEAYRRQKKILFVVFLSIGLTSTFFLFKLFSYKEIFSNEQFNYSLLFVLSLGLSAAFYYLFSSFNYLEKNKEIEQIENELPVALFQLSIESSTGKPFEVSVEEMIPRIKETKIKDLFEKVISNIKNLGMSLESAFFDKNYGALVAYPSRILEATLKVVIDISKRGAYLLSSALKTISSFLMDAGEVNNITEEILSEISSEIQIIHLIFAPLTSGIIVGLMAIVIYLFAQFGQSLQNLEQWLATSGFKSVGIGTFGFFLNIDKLLPFPYFQIVVGIYLLELVYILSSFLGEIRHGDNEVNKSFDIGKALFLALIIYSLVVTVMFYGIASLIKPSELGALA